MNSKAGTGTRGAETRALPLKEEWARVCLPFESRDEKTKEWEAVSVSGSRDVGQQRDRIETERRNGDPRVITSASFLATHLPAQDLLIHSARRGRSGSANLSENDRASDSVGEK